MNLFGPVLKQRLESKEFLRKPRGNPSVNLEMCSMARRVRSLIKHVHSSKFIFIIGILFYENQRTREMHNEKR